MVKNTDTFHKLKNQKTEKSHVKDSDQNGQNAVANPYFSYFCNQIETLWK